jgi:hypothetical protein
MHGFNLELCVVEVVVGQEPRPVEDVEEEEEDGHGDAAHLFHLLERTLRVRAAITGRLPGSPPLVDLEKPGANVMIKSSVDFFTFWPSRHFVGLLKVDIMTADISEVDVLT